MDKYFTMKKFKEWFNQRLDELTNLDPLILDRLKDLRADNLLYFKINQAFIFDFKNKKIYLGHTADHNTGSYHSRILSQNSENEHLANVYSYYKPYEDEVSNKEIPLGVVGRIGKGGYSYDDYDEEKVKIPENITVIAFYTKDNYTHEAGQAAIKELLKQRLIEQKDIVVAQKLATDVASFLQGYREITDEERRHGNLQVAYHLGAWPNGKRLTPQEKQAIAKELGIASYPMKKNPWQKGMEDQGIIKPGQKWWAPTSESV